MIDEEIKIAKLFEEYFVNIVKKKNKVQFPQKIA